MAVFAAYAAYYDLLNRDKDYAGEAALVEDLIRDHRPDATSLLELGCGTGAHAEELARRGWRVTGSDFSRGMLDGARARAAALPPDLGQRLDFLEGDARTLRLERTFDAVGSLFHVVSYQTGDDDLLGTLKTARAHLSPGGVFVFDIWYGPAVLTDRPAVRVRRMEDEAISVIRIAEPRMAPRGNLVHVDYHIVVMEKASGLVTEVRETHSMRYLFEPDLRLFCRDAGLDLVEVSAWGTRAEPGFDTWSVGCVARAV
ncbi:MAG: class I SAM-dependent methyltransferase [Magnetospirillum sp.]|nr:class I SAM-dependent methyltransferase [Magnetospirillum sp.]